MKAVLLQTNKNKKAGFTFIEIMVVMAMLGILSVMVLVTTNEARESSEKAKVSADLKDIHTSMEMLFNETGLYPHQRNRYCPPQLASGNEVDLSLPSSGLVDTDGNFPGWNGPYAFNVTDPWGSPYFFDEDYFCTAGAIGCDEYETTGTPDHSVLVSCGPDGLLGDDTSNSAPSNGTACAYNDDNIVYVLCKE